jgi:demethylmenaquinone methyltransferase/2-methoxy-6-polyprenyl-1,4-benzoquinol methylase
VRIFTIKDGQISSVYRNRAQGSSYLRDSVNKFMNKKQLKEKFSEIGFKNAEYESLTFGISSIHYGIK